MRLSFWVYLGLAALICGIIDFFAASFQSVGDLFPDFIEWFLKLFGAAAAVTLLFRLGCALLAALVCYRLGVLVSAFVVVTVLFSVPFIDTFLAVVLVGWLTHV